MILDVGRELRNKRKAQKMSQKDLGEEAGVHYSTISRLESGGSADLSIVQNLFSVLGYTFILIPYTERKRLKQRDD